MRSIHFRFGAAELILSAEMRPGRKRAERMRAVVDCLPYDTKLAMLDGLDRYEIIAGAYSDRQGRVCPMLAAHRCGGRTDFRAFARAWDRFTGVGKRARRASERELRTLRAHLERSVWNDECQRESVTRLPDREPPEPVSEPPVKKGGLGAWLLPVRDWDEYRAAVSRALAQLETAGAGTPVAPAISRNASEAPGGAEPERVPVAG
jgi:hypothetical protein